MQVFAETLYRRYLQAFGQDAPLEDRHYRGTYMTEMAERIRAEYGDRFLNMPEAEADRGAGRARPRQW